MNRGLSVFFGALAALALCVQVYADAYLDDCASQSGDEVRSYSGFGAAHGRFSDYAGWPGCGDDTALPVEGRTARAVYRVRGADTLRVELYSLGSTVATPGVGGGFKLGGSSAAALQNARQCFYDRAHDAVFVTEGGKCYSLRMDNRYNYLFQEDARELSADCRWGLTVLSSPDGVSYAPTEAAELTEVRSQRLDGYYGSYYRESHTVRLPEDAAYICLSLEDFEEIPGAPPGAVDRANALLLASARFEGDGLAAGGEESSSEPEPSEPGPSGDSSVPAESSPLPEGGGAAGSARPGGSGGGGRLLRERGAVPAAAGETLSAASGRRGGGGTRSRPGAGGTEEAPDVSGEIPGADAGTDTGAGTAALTGFGGEHAGAQASGGARFPGVVSGGAGLWILFNTLWGLRR